MTTPDPPDAPPPAPTPPAPSSSGNRGLMIVLAYLWLLALIPLLVEKDDKEVQWHAKHGLVLLGSQLVFWIGFTMLTTMMGLVTGGVGCLLQLMAPLLALAFLAIHVVCIVKALNGQRFLIPYLSQYADRF